MQGNAMAVCTLLWPHTHKPGSVHTDHIHPDSEKTQTPPLYTCVFYTTYTHRQEKETHGNSIHLANITHRETHTAQISEQEPNS